MKSKGLEIFHPPPSMTKEERKKIEKVEVKFCYRPQIDLGQLLPQYATGKIKVKRDLWEKYVHSRYEYEVVLADLLKSLSRAEQERLDESFGVANWKANRSI